ncbi:MAG: ATP-binding cassette domain-containing protein [Solirubrobacterales bacterium]
MSNPHGLEVSIRIDRREFLLDVDLELERGQRLALVGPSGAGKTSILRAVAGLVKPESGEINIGGETVFSSAGRIDLPPEVRRSGYVSQDYSLFPHLTASANVIFAMRHGKTRERRLLAADLLTRLGVGGLADVKPAALSGGEKQRVALARALATEPAVFLFDEPLAALDSETRDQAIPVIDQVLSEAGVPALIVTHSRSEAERLADTSVMIDRGRISESRDHGSANRWNRKARAPEPGKKTVSIHRVIRK